MKNSACEQANISITPIKNYLEKPETLNLLALHGWKKEPIGETVRKDYCDCFDLFVRKRKLSEIFSNKENIKNDSIEDEMSFVSNLGEFETFKKIQTDEKSICIGYSAKQFDTKNVDLLSTEIWQFCVVDAEGCLLEFIFIRKTPKKLLTLEIALGSILDWLNIKPKLARRIPKGEAKNEKGTNSGKKEQDDFINVSLICFNGIESIYRLRYSYNYENKKRS